MSSVSPEAAPAPSTNGTQQQQQQQSSPRNKPSSSTLHSYSTTTSTTTTATSEEAHHHPNQFWDCFCDLEVPEGRVVGLNLTTTIAVDDLLLEPTTASQDNNKHWIYAWLHPDEVAYATTQSSSSRRETFIIGRMALREALKRVSCRNGQDDGTMALPTECNNSNNSDNQHLIQSIPPILKDQYGRPTMPPGYVGSISHKDRAGVGIVARDTTFFGGSYHGIGIDLERTTNPRRNIARRVLTEREIESLGQLEV